VVFLLISVIFSVAVEYGSLVLNPLNPELNLSCRLLALLGARHILHVSRIRVTPIFHLLALLGAHYILHVSRIRVNPICHLLALLGKKVNQFHYRPGVAQRVPGS